MKTEVGGGGAGGEITTDQGLRVSSSSQTVEPPSHHASQNGELLGKKTFFHASKPAATAAVHTAALT